MSIEINVICMEFRWLIETSAVNQLIEKNLKRTSPDKFYKLKQRAQDKRLSNELANLSTPNANINDLSLPDSIRIRMSDAILPDVVTLHYENMPI